MLLSIKSSKLNRVPEADGADTSRIAPQTSAAPVVIAAVGMDERMLFAISLFFKSRLGERYAFGSPQDAAVWLFDVDHAEGRLGWDTHQLERPGVPAIVVSIMEKDLAQAQNAIFALKPLSAERLKEALEKVSRSPRAQIRAVPSSKDSSLDLVDARGISRESASGSAPLSSESTQGPDTFMPDSEWYQDPQASQEASDVESSGGAAVLGTSPTQRSAPGCYGAAAKLGEKHARVFIGSTPDIDVTDPRQLEKAQFDPETFLAGAVSRASAIATREQVPVKVSGIGWDIVIQPNPDYAFVDIQKVQLRTLATLPLQGQVSVKALDKSMNGYSFAGTKWRLQAFQWTLTLMASRGRIPLDTDMSAKVKLAHWPNLSRLQTFPHAMRIASLWSREPITLVESAKVLGIPQRYVFAFYSAVQALGMVEARRTEVPVQDRSDKRPAKGRLGLFRKILAHLHLG